MLILKCTGQVQKALGLRLGQVADASPLAVGPSCELSADKTPLGAWYVHRFQLGRTRLHLFMSEVTLLSFVFFQGKRAVDIQTLPNMFMGGLSQLLTVKGCSEDELGRAMDGYDSGLFAKTDSRRLLGSMNDLVRCYSTMIEFQGGLDACDLTQTIMKINDMPQVTLGGKSSWELTMDLLSVRALIRH